MVPLSCCLSRPIVPGTSGHPGTSPSVLVWCPNPAVCPVLLSWGHQDVLGHHPLSQYGAPVLLPIVPGTSGHPGTSPIVLVWCPNPAVCPVLLSQGHQNVLGHHPVSQYDAPILLSVLSYCPGDIRTSWDITHCPGMMPQSCCLSRPIVPGTSGRPGTSPIVPV